MKNGPISFDDHAESIKDALKEGWIDELLKIQENEQVSLNPFADKPVESFYNTTILLSIREGNLEFFKKLIQKENLDLVFSDNLALDIAAKRGRLNMVNLLLQNPQVLTYVKANLSKFIEKYPKIKLALNSQNNEHVLFRVEFDRLTGRNVNPDAILDDALNNLIGTTQKLFQNPSVIEAHTSIASSQDPVDQMFLGFFNTIIAQANQGLRELAQPAATHSSPIFSFNTPTTPQPAAPNQTPPSQQATLQSAPSKTKP